MSSPTTSVDFDLPPVTPTLPVNPKIEDYERASEYERCKLTQIKRTFEQLKAEYSHLDDACTNAMAGQGQSPVESNGDVAKKETQALQTPFHSKSTSLENTPAAGPSSTGQHVRRKSSLNASAPAFVPGFLGGGGGGGGDFKGSSKSA